MSIATQHKASQRILTRIVADGNGCPSPVFVFEKVVRDESAILVAQAKKTRNEFQTRLGGFPTDSWAQNFRFEASVCFCFPLTLQENVGSKSGPKMQIHIDYTTATWIANVGFHCEWLCVFHSVICLSFNYIRPRIRWFCTNNYLIFIKMTATRKRKIIIRSPFRKSLAKTKPVKDEKNVELSLFSKLFWQSEFNKECPPANNARWSTEQIL